MKSAAVNVIIDDTSNFYQSVEQATIQKNRQKFNKIYKEMGVAYTEDPSSLSEMLQPLGELMQKMGDRSTSDSPQPTSGAQQVDSEGTR